MQISFSKKIQVHRIMARHSPEKPARTTAGKMQERPKKRARVDQEEVLSRTKGSPLKEPSAKSAIKSSRKGKEKEVPTTENDDASPKKTFLPTTFKVIAGSYEKLLYGLQGSVTLSSESAPSTSTSAAYPYTFHLTPIFIFPAHVSCIKAVAASPEGGKWLATGSADEIIKVWDLRRRKEIGGLMHHQGPRSPLPFLNLV